MSASLVVSRGEHARAFNRSTFWPAVIAAAGVAALVCTPWGQRTTGVAPAFVIAVTVLWIASDAFYTFAVSYDTFVAKPWLRTIESLRTIAFCSVFGASSSFEASPAYALALVAGSGNGLMLQHRNPVVLVAMVVAPVMIRAAAVGSGLAVAAVVGCVSLVMSILIGREHERGHLLREAFEEESRRLEERRAEVRGLALAMALHDNLSGALLVLQTELSTAASLDAQSVARFVARARALVRDGGSRTVRLLDELREHGCAVSVDAAAYELPRDEQRDVTDIAWETAMNAKRASAQNITLTVTVDSLEVSVRCDTRGGHSSVAGGGRGLRYAKLRAVWRGGDSHLATGEVTRFEAHWPRRAAPPKGSARFGLSNLALMVVGGAGLGLIDNHHAALWLPALAAVAELGMSVVSVRAMRKAEHDYRQLDAERELFDAQHAAIADRLAQATTIVAAAHDLRSARAGLDVFADALSRAMRELEGERSVSATVPSASPAA